ncbi:hypothetical protein LINGRAHAP2_LOCUS33641 [Linum grandiflorum]
MDVIVPTANPHSLVEIGWQPGPTGWMTLNTDGSITNGGNKVAIGDLLKDEFGRCHSAFTTNLGTRSITRAEMQGLLTGLSQA